MFLNSKMSVHFLQIEDFSWIWEITKYNHYLICKCYYCKLTIHLGWLSTSVFNMYIRVFYFETCCFFKNWSSTETSSKVPLAATLLYAGYQTGVCAGIYFLKQLLSFNVKSRDHRRWSYFVVIQGSRDHHKDTKILILQLKKNDVRQKEYNSLSIFTTGHEHWRQLTHSFCL